MLPSDINTYARAKYNATGDTFFADTEIYYYIYQAELELAAEAPLIYETTSNISFTATYTLGATFITANSATGLVKGQTLTNMITSANFAANTTITSIVGLTVNISQATLGATTITAGDTIYATNTVQKGQRIYPFPTNARIIKRIEYSISGGQTVKLEPITQREDDALTLVNTGSLTLGKPQFYTQFNSFMFLRPIPDNSNDSYLIYYFSEPAIPTASSTLECPTLFHMDLVDYVVKEMYAKDKDPNMYMLFDAKWQKAIQKAKIWSSRRKRGDAYSIVMNEDNLAVTLTGPV